MVEGSTFTDLELQWFRGGIRVTDVINLVTEAQIVSVVVTYAGTVCQCGCFAPLLPQDTTYSSECTF